jgi:hypothetical protein
VGFGGFVRRLDRLVGRFNRWFGPAAIAAGSLRSEGGIVQTADPTAVVASLGEIQKDRGPAREGDEGGDERR